MSYTYYKTLIEDEIWDTEGVLCPIIGGCIVVDVDSGMCRKLKEVTQLLDNHLADQFVDSPITDRPVLTMAEFALRRGNSFLNRIAIEIYEQENRMRLSKIREKNEIIRFEGAGFAILDFWIVLKFKPVNNEEYDKMKRLIYEDLLLDDYKMPLPFVKLRFLKQNADLERIRKNMEEIEAFLKERFVYQLCTRDNMMFRKYFKINQFRFQGDI